MHTYDRWGGEQHFREMNIEIGRWGDTVSKDNAQYGIQPFYVPGNMVRFTEPSGTLTHTLVWESGRASFKTVRGSSLRAVGPVFLCTGYFSAKLKISLRSRGHPTLGRHSTPGGFETDEGAALGEGQFRTKRLCLSKTSK
jgi:hypothetical protein